MMRDRARLFMIETADRLTTRHCTPSASSASTSVSSSSVSSPPVRSPCGLITTVPFSLFTCVWRSACMPFIATSPGPRVSPRSCPDRRERVVELLDRLVHVGGGRDQRRRNAEHVAVEPALADQEPALLRLLEQPRGGPGIGRAVLARLVFHQLH